ncbi:hypothetical protein K501DRAFT_65967 [Backusella circina FSU 941]|nr:hypothetical protein K501DRAFT_65967 [Backusella circina FSU 941]
MNTIKSTCSKREIITYQFQPNHRFDAIKHAIIKRCKQNLPKQTLTVKNLPEKSLTTKLPVGGLPSPPIDEKPRLSSTVVKERIKALQDEKHKLFQMLKQLVVDQENLKKQQKQRQEQLEQLEQLEQRRTKRRKKTRWSPPVYSYKQTYYPLKTQPPYSR